MEEKTTLAEINDEGVSTTRGKGAITIVMTTVGGAKTNMRGVT